MRLTPLAKAFIAVVVLAVIGFATWHYKGDAIKEWAGGEKAAGEDSKGDFDKLNNAPGDPGRNVGSTGVSAASVGTGRLNRPLVVGINTWAGHAPGIVFNNGMDPNAGSQYKTKYGMDVKFVLLEDPAAKLAAFRSGQVDIMWNTVDNWAREASILAAQEQAGQVDHHAGLVAWWRRHRCTFVDQVSRRSEGQQDRVHSVHAVTLPAALPVVAIRADRRRTAPTVEKNIMFTTDAPAAAAAFKAKQVDAAVTWEPDLSGAVTARGAEAHVLVSTQAATNIIADTLCARQDVIDQAPETVRDFVRGWLDGIEMIKNNPNGSYEVVGRALKLDTETVSGMLSGLKLTPYADNAQFYGLTGSKGALRNVVRYGVCDLAQERVWSTKSVDAKGWADTRFLQAVASALSGTES